MQLKELFRRIANIYKKDIKKYAKDLIFLEKFENELLNRSRLRKTFISKQILPGEIFILNCAIDDKVYSINMEGTALEPSSFNSNKCFPREFWIINYTNSAPHSDEAIQEFIAKENAILNMVKSEAKRLKLSFPLKGLLGIRIPITTLPIINTLNFNKYGYGELISIAIWKK